METAHETIEWHRDPADLPDADTTCLVELNPAFDYSEPVFLGFYGDGEWRDVHGEVVEVIAWAHLPGGTRTAALRIGGESADRFCDLHCTWRDHHPDCARAGVRVDAPSDPLRQAAEQFVASCKDGNVKDLLGYYEEIFIEALGVQEVPHD